MPRLFGYGSLMDKTSCLRTMPHSTNFQPAVLFGYKRVFSLVSVWGLRTGIASEESKELAAVSIEPSPLHCVKGVVFDIPDENFPSYLDREHRYYCIDVNVSLKQPSTAGVEAKENVAIAVAPSTVTVAAKTVVLYKTNEEYYDAKYKSEEEWHERVGQYYQGALFSRRDILPMRRYLTDCLDAASALGGTEWVENFYDECFLSDGTTSIRSYLSAHPDRFPLHSGQSGCAGSQKDARDQDRDKTCEVKGSTNGFVTTTRSKM